MITGDVSNSEEVFSLLNPKQKLMWDKYTNPKSKTFGSARGSAMAAGFSQSYSDEISNYAWFRSRMLRLNLLGKAEKVLNKTLDMETVGENGREQADLLRVQNDAAKFVAKTLGKDEGYNERTELTGANGQPIVFLPAELMEKYNIGSDVEDEMLLLDNQDKSMEETEVKVDEVQEQTASEPTPEVVVEEVAPVEAAPLAE